VSEIEEVMEDEDFENPEEERLDWMGWAIVACVFFWAAIAYWKLA